MSFVSKAEQVRVLEAVATPRAYVALAREVFDEAGGTGLTEIDVDGYVRQYVRWSVPDEDRMGRMRIWNVDRLEFGEFGGERLISHFMITDAPTGGNIRRAHALEGGPLMIGAGGTCSFGISQLRLFAG